MKQGASSLSVLLTIQKNQGFKTCSEYNEEIYISLRTVKVGFKDSKSTIFFFKFFFQKL